jgi:hypothetical protein
MGKGDKPRNCFSVEFRDNYDEINWNVTKPDDWNESSEIFKGMVKQSNETPIQEESCDGEQDESCA